MDLTSELLLDFFDQARKYVKKRLPERRKGGRLALSAAAQMRVRGDAKNAVIDVNICNLSTTGVALLAPRPMINGMEFCLRLPKENNRARWVRCRVMRWQASPSGACQVGAQFCDLVCTDTGELPVLVDTASAAPSDDPEMALWMKDLAAVEVALQPAPSPGAPPVPQAAESDHRQARRVPIKFFSIATLIEPPQRHRLIRILIQDISTGGIGFYCSTPLPKGAHVAFTLAFADKKTKAILARVVRTTNVATNQFLIGAALVEGCEHPSPEAPLPSRWLAIA